MFKGTVQLPVSGKDKRFSASDRWLNDLGALEKFAVRRGNLGFRGWKPKKIPIASEPLSDEDFIPVFEQKGVDMRIGLDIATFSEKQTVDRIILVSGDTDMIPAMKQARKSGLEVGIVQFSKPTPSLQYNLLIHSDFVRYVEWPKDS